MIQTTARASRRVPRHPTALGVAVFLVAVGCGESPGGPAGPETRAPPELLGNPVEGEKAFLTSCAPCHASRDGFDLAAFDFTDFDIVRRALAHVDSATGRDIAAHIDGLRETPSRRTAAPFQPDGRIRGDRPAHLPPVGDQDMEFWVDVFGTTGFPITDAAQLRAIDPRDFAVPFAMPLWSIEGSEEDWMPDNALPPEVLDADGGALGSAIAAYYGDTSEARLVHAMDVFETATTGPGRLCWRQDPVPCFDARRWMASLGGQHYLRVGDESGIPAEVARVWWDVGESAIALQSVASSDEERAEAFRIGASWMWLAYSYQPEAFREPAEYMGTFLREHGRYRMALFAALRRMVGDGVAHREHPDQFLEDGRLAVRRSDGEVGLAVTEFVFGHHAARLRAGLPPGLDTARARDLVEETWAAARAYRFQDPTRWAAVTTLYDEVIRLLR
ncbi:MAG: hypothetical protein R3195_07630 [Gemmatimonadota bacterium]|nr:hypothetical protein [Gemmatimonadota bacterium]